MPHIHTEPGQHDITVSAWIFKEHDDGELRVLVHMHRKLGKLMQVGGHVEIDETPWQTLAHELSEEAGFGLGELQILQPYKTIPSVAGATVHPLPALSNTHKVSETHYHSDYGYAFIAKSEPKNAPADGESTDLRWITIDELYVAVKNGEALQDVAEIYDAILQNALPLYHRIDATLYSVKKPSKSLLE